MEVNDWVINIPLLIPPCLFLLLIINVRIQMKITNNPNTPPTTEGTMIVNGVEADVSFIGIVLVGAINVVIVLVTVVISWILAVDRVLIAPNLTGQIDWVTSLMLTVRMISLKSSMPVQNVKISSL